MDAGGQDDTGSLGVTCLASGLLMGFVTSWDPEGGCSCLNPLAFSSISSAPALPTAKCRKISFQFGLFWVFLKAALKGGVGLICVNNPHFQGAQGWGNWVAAVFYPCAQSWVLPGLGPSGWGEATVC